MRYGYIAIEGPIGVGKTTLAKLIAERLSDTMLVLEDVDNPFLPDFYDDAAGSAFRTQLFFLLRRHEQLKKLSQRELFLHRVVSDFTFEKDKIFAYLTLADGELLIYDKLYEMLAAQVPRPEMIVYLTAGQPTLMKRIRERGRNFELQISANYLDEVSRAYNYYFFNYTRTPLLVVNTDELDFVHREEDLIDLMAQIGATEQGTRYYVPRR
jgi:deoxyguanosine kinase